MAPTAGPTVITATPRLRAIEQARRHWLPERAPGPVALEGWILASWQRCLAQGRHPGERIAFDTVSAAAQQRALQASAARRCGAGDRGHAGAGDA